MSSFVIRPIKNNINKILANNDNIKNKIQNIYSFNFNNINRITTNILYQKLLTTKNYPNEKQVYNKMFQKAVNDIQFFLRQDETFFNTKLTLIKGKCKRMNIVETLKELEKDNKINVTFSYKKFYYILFFYLGITRNLINILQKNTGMYDLECFFYGSNYKNHGFPDLFTKMNGKVHPLIMDRFDNYILRLIYNNSMYDNKKINPHCVSASCVFFKKSNEKYGINRRFSYISTNYSLAENIESRVNTLNLILELFTNLDTGIITTIEEKKKCIVEIYYYIMILMPFALGTASIAEMFLYSLWKFYIGTRLEIRQSIMLDVEALTNNFDVFYNNCFNHDDNENNPSILRQIEGYNEATYISVLYTPYFNET